MDPAGDLSTWIAESGDVSFPSSMVDRITPAPDVPRINDRLGEFACRAPVRSLGPRQVSTMSCGLGTLGARDGPLNSLARTNKVRAEWVNTDWDLTAGHRRSGAAVLSPITTHDDDDGVRAALLCRLRE